MSPTLSPLLELVIYICFDWKLWLWVRIVLQVLIMVPCQCYRTAWTANTASLLLTVFNKNNAPWQFVKLKVGNTL